MRVISGFGMSETTFGLIEDPYGERRSGSMGKARQHPDPAFVNEARDRRRRRRRGARRGSRGARSSRTRRSCAATSTTPRRRPSRSARAGSGPAISRRRDEDGFFYYLDRKKDIVRRRGENVSSVEVEVVLTAHPAVEEAAVVGVPSELTEEEILALVQLLPGAERRAGRARGVVQGAARGLQGAAVHPARARAAEDLDGKLQKGALRDDARRSRGLVGRGGELTRVLVLPGDCIGPEITVESRRVLARLAPDVELEEKLFGAAAIRATGTPLPEDTLAAAVAVDRRPQGPGRGSRVRRRRRPPRAGAAGPPQGARRLREPAARPRARDRPAGRARARRRALLRREGRPGGRHRLRHVRVPPRPGRAHRPARVRARPHASAERSSRSTRRT